MLRIGLTGGIASGKSAASARFATLGARVIDHDDLAREAVRPGSAALSDIAKRFGDQVITRGELDRSALARVVFGDRLALTDLNAIVHPYVYALGHAADRRAREEGVAVIVHAIPLLVETGNDDGFDLVVTVAAPVEVRIERMIASRGMTREEALERIAAQASDDVRAAAADVVLDGSGTLDQLFAQVDRFWFEHVPVSARQRSLEA